MEKRPRKARPFDKLRTNSPQKQQRICGRCDGNGGTRFTTDEPARTPALRRRNQNQVQNPKTLEFILTFEEGGAIFCTFREPSRTRKAAQLNEVGSAVSEPPNPDRERSRCRGKA